LSVAADYARLLGPHGPLAAALPGFEPRREQQQMAAWVGEALATRGTLIVEAGTGTGKTFAYLVPALLSGCHVVISTGTRTLQDQLYHRDLPLLARALGRPVKVALLKGRSNYLCRHRLALAAANPSLPGFERTAARALSRVRAWSLETKSGDLAELDSLSDADPVWALVTSTRDNCVGSSCPEFARCHVVAARREAQAADVVVVNHHLLLADLALKEEGFGDLLPGADAVILDEAHQVPETAAQFFGVSAGSRQAVALARDIQAELTRAGVANAATRALLLGLEDAFAHALAELPRGAERVAWEALPAGFIEALDAAVSRLDALQADLDALGADEAGIRQCERRAIELAAALRTIQELDPATGVRWVEVHARSFALQFTPLEVAGRLRELMRARPCAWVFTSATLAVGDDFAHYIDRVGAEQARVLRIESPFDYRSQARLLIPAGLPDPSDRAHTAAVVAEALPFIVAAGGRTFLLFTSHRALAEAARLLRAQADIAAGYTLLVQGEVPREQLLQRFRETPRSVLLGTSSFWEGVDVRGRALAVVVIDKLPFASPDDPLLKARLEAIRARGGNPFFDHQVPQAVLALKQGFGRLIRDHGDFGVVVICDHRLRSKGYGRSFLQALPPAPVAQDRAAALAFLVERLRASTEGAAEDKGT
jgi:ATP-dependent DNA helicase DinG